MTPPPPPPPLPLLEEEEEEEEVLDFTFAILALCFFPAW
jgi:hypothetical protein